MRPRPCLDKLCGSRNTFASFPYSAFLRTAQDSWFHRTNENYLQLFQVDFLFQDQQNRLNVAPFPNKGLSPDLFQGGQMNDYLPKEMPTMAVSLALKTS